jgi:KDO2-lipid IV(A) lauroyltransferase
MKRLAHLLQSSLLEALAAVAVRIPYATALGMGRALGRSLYGLGVRRQVVHENLRLAFPEWDAVHLRRTARGCYSVWGMTLVDYLRIPRLRSAEDWAEMMGPIAGLEHVARARRAGKGVILLSGHFGNFELMGAAVAAAGHPVQFLVQAQANARLERLLDARRAALGVGVIDRGSQLRGAMRALRANGCVALAGDQDARGRGVFVDFFGRPSSTPVGPAALSLRTGAPIVMGFAVRGADGRHRGTILPALQFTPTGAFDADVAALTQRHAAVLEEWVRRHPEHWYWLHRRWKSRPPGSPPGREADRARRSALGAAAVALALLVTGGVGAQPPTPPPAQSPAGPDRSDATNFGGAGSSLMPLAETRVGRVIEDLSVRRDSQGWTVDAVDVFQAGGAPETVPIGLPDFQAVSDSGQAQATLSEVRLLLDGVDLPPAIEPPPVGKDLPGLGGIGRLFTWRLPFDTDDRKVVRLHFRVRSSRTERGEELLFFYLNTGTPWRGPSGRISARFELGDLSTDDLVAGWLRPGHFGVGPGSITWILTGEEPEEDLVLALRDPRDPMEDFPDHERGPLALSAVERDDWLARGTPREWRFWLAFVRAHLGEAPADSSLRARFSSEPWYRARAAGHLKQPGAPEAALQAALERRLAAWEGHGIPTAADSSARPAAAP